MSSVRFDAHIFSHTSNLATAVIWVYYDISYISKYFSLVV